MKINLRADYEKRLKNTLEAERKKYTNRIQELEKHNNELLMKNEVLETNSLLNNKKM